jgi:hypothetical protein
MLGAAAAQLVLTGKAARAPLPQAIDLAARQTCHARESLNGDQDWWELVRHA